MATKRQLRTLAHSLLLGRVCTPDSTLNGRRGHTEGVPHPIIYPDIWSDGLFHCLQVMISVFTGRFTFILMTDGLLLHEEMPLCAKFPLIRTSGPVL